MKKLSYLSAIIFILIISSCSKSKVTPTPVPTQPDFSFSPTSGPVGTLVTITGTNLGSPTTFTIGDVSAITLSATSSELVGMVMPGAKTGKIAITTAGGTLNNSSNFTITPELYPTMQQGAKLVGTGWAVSNNGVNQGECVSISADGNTAIVGGPGDEGGLGAAWIYTRNNGTWAQQGAKLVGSGANVGDNLGYSVAISADGNTAIAGGFLNNKGLGAAWIFTRNNGTWTQQGTKLVGSDFTGPQENVNQGEAVSISADGNTVIVGGDGDNNYIGAAWIFSRVNGVWAQQGAKLVGTNAIGYALEGISVSVSADGNTAILGGYGDNSHQGAVWIFSRTNGVWAQQGDKLLGSGAVGDANQGWSVSLSADGNTALEGGYFDNNHQGAAWVFTRGDGLWTQQGAKLVGTGVVGDRCYQGNSVSLSADGNTALIGGSGDNTNVGAAWVYARNGGTWTQHGTKLTGTGSVGAANQGWFLSLSSDGSTAIVGGFTDNSGLGATWIYAQ